MSNPSPSTAWIWGSEGGCTAFPSMSSGYPDISDQTAREEGRLAHKIAENAIISGGEILADDPEMGMHVAVYVDYVREQIGGVEVEKRVNCFDIHEKSNGMIDTIIVNCVLRTIEIIDFKYGHRVTDAIEQLTMYASAVPWPIDYDMILTVVQPRGAGDDVIRSKFLTREEYDVTVDRLQTKAIEVVEGGTQHSGEHCSKCNARADCPAAYKAGVSLYEATAGNTPLNMSAKALSVQLTMLDRATKHLDAMKVAIVSETKSRIKGGELIPGWEMESRAGNLGWLIDVDIVEAIGMSEGLNLIKPREPITVTQALALAKRKNVDLEAIEGCSQRKPGYTKLKQINFKQIRKILS